MPLPKPKTGESRDDWFDRCMGDPRMISEFEDSDQRAAVCIRTFNGDKEPETNEVSLKPPQSVRNNYKRGLELHEEGKTGKGIEAGTIKVARDIVAGEAVTEEWVRKANRFWGRNERFLGYDEDTPAYASAMLWGGAAGRDWYRSKAKQLEGNNSREEALRKKVEDHNDKYGDDKTKRATVGMLKKVYDRGVGAYETNPESVHEGVQSAEQWAMGRVNAFLSILAGKRSSTLFDTDLLPEGHPKKGKGKEANVGKQPAMNFKEGSRIRANVRCEVNQSQVRREQRDGREVVVVPSYTLPDDVIMNGILYPTEEIEKSYKTLEGTPAPLGHPMVNSMFVSAKTPLGLNIGYFGAWNANVSRVDGRVFIEKVIDVERAQESKMGRRVLEALDSGKPIHTSTGLLMNLRECNTSDLADYEGFDMEFDHDAILLDEDGAATPEQGVGMMVNDDRLMVVNSDIAERMDDQVDMLGMELLAVLDRREAASRWARIKEAIMEVVGLGRDMGSGPQRKEAMNMAGQNEEGGDMEKIMSRMDKLEERMNKMDEMVKNMGSKTNAHEEALSALNAERDAAKAELVNKAVEAELLSEEDAKATPTPALQALLNAAKQKPTPAPGIHAGYNGAGDKVSLAEDWEK